jgi:hypothetical protein
MQTGPVNIKDWVIGNPNTVVKDRSPLWNRMADNNIDRPFFHGTVGPQWRPQIQEADADFNAISSPHPKPQISKRIIANDLPPVTVSPSSFDLPMRKDVVQIDLPQSKTRVTEERIDPRIPVKVPVQKVGGTMYHGAKTTNENIVQGLPNMLEKSSAENTVKTKKNKNNVRVTKKARKTQHKAQHRAHKLRKHPNADLDQARSFRNEAKAYAHSSHINASNILSSVINKIPQPVDPVLKNPLARGSDMILDVDVVNRREFPDMKIHEHNHTKHRMIEDMKQSPEGVRAMHTYSKLQ